ncbi:Uncharacterised protein [Chlamydia abortus]|nr:Uncharacterised protein [Chlamydia abortus]
MHDFLFRWGIFIEKRHDFCVKWGIFAEKTRRDFWVKWGIFEEKMCDFQLNHGISKRKCLMFALNV